MIILVEVMSLIFLMLLSSQKSSLLSSLIIIPLGLSFILMSVSTNNYSGFIILIYMMVFIGGLLVLLVSVSSISFQEQSLSNSKMMLIMCSIFLPYFFVYQISSFNSALMSVMWFESQGFLLFVMLLIIFISLFVLTKNIFSFKGLIRLV